MSWKKKELKPYIYFDPKEKADLHHGQRLQHVWRCIMFGGAALSFKKQLVINKKLSTVLSALSTVLSALSTVLSALSTVLRALSTVLSAQS